MCKAGKEGFKNGLFDILAIIILILTVAFLTGCASDRYSPVQAAEDAKVLITAAANEVSFRLTADGKAELAANIQENAETVKELLDDLVLGRETSIGVLRKALLAVEKEVTEAVAASDSDKKDLILHEINQVHVIVSYFIDRYERSLVLELQE